MILLPLRFNVILAEPIHNLVKNVAATAAVMLNAVHGSSYPPQEWQRLCLVSEQFL